MPIEASPTFPFVWLGRAFSGLAVAFWLFDDVIKRAPMPAVMDTLQALGFSPGNDSARGLGASCLFCTVLYATPETSLPGAILLTGDLGGAMAIQIRAGNPLLGLIMYVAYVGPLVWSGLLVGNGTIRAALFPQEARCVAAQLQ
jgi:hypothetical protein